MKNIIILLLVLISYSVGMSAQDSLDVRKISMSFGSKGGKKIVRAKIKGDNVKVYSPVFKTTYNKGNITVEADACTDSLRRDIALIYSGNKGIAIYITQFPNSDSKVRCRECGGSGHFVSTNGSSMSYIGTLSEGANRALGGENRMAVGKYSNIESPTYQMCPACYGSGYQ